MEPAIWAWVHNFCLWINFVIFFLIENDQNIRIWLGPPFGPNLCKASDQNVFIYVSTPFRPNLNVCSKLWLRKFMSKSRLAIKMQNHQRTSAFWMRTQRIHKQNFLPASHILLFQHRSMALLLNSCFILLFPMIRSFLNDDLFTWTCVLGHSIVDMHWILKNFLIFDENND